MRILLSIFTVTTALLTNNLITKTDQQDASTPPVHLEALLQSNLKSVDSHVVLLSRVTIQPHQNLARHTHPTEEFLYVVKGETILHQQNADDIHLSAGQVYKIPPQTIHSASTKAQAAEIIVFRVHEKGKPVRTLVE